MDQIILNGWGVWHDYLAKYKFQTQDRLLSLCYHYVRSLSGVPWKCTYHADDIVHIAETDIDLHCMMHVLSNWCAKNKMTINPLTPTFNTFEAH